LKGFLVFEVLHLEGLFGLDGRALLVGVYGRRGRVVEEGRADLLGQRLRERDCGEVGLGVHGRWRGLVDLEAGFLNVKAHFCCCFC